MCDVAAGSCCVYWRGLAFTKSVTARAHTPSPATAADSQKQWRLHNRLIKQLREYMADEELSAETMANIYSVSTRYSNNNVTVSIRNKS